MYNQTELSPKEAAFMLGIKYPTVCSAIRRGKLTARKQGWGWLITREALKDWQDNRPYWAIERYYKRQPHDAP